MSKKNYIQEQRIKPIGRDGIEKCREIMKGYAQKVNQVFVDSFSASAIIAVYDKLSEENKEKLAGLPVAKAAGICFKLIK